MTQVPFNAAGPKQFCLASVNVTRNVLVWFTGLPGEMLMQHRKDVQMRYTSAGLAMVIWFIFMLCAWVKTGLYFFGTGGGFVFSLVPALMLAVDRMILGQCRNPAGALAAYALDELEVKHWEYGLRAVIALVFSAVTTSVFLIAYAAPDIRAQQQRDQHKANAPLRAELAGRVDAQAAERMRSVSARSAELEAHAVILKEEHALARKTAEEAESRVSTAQFNVAAEWGGLEGRHLGDGPRHKAYSMIASQNRDTAVNARARETRAREALAKVQAELQQLSAQREGATSARNAGMANLDAEMQDDTRFVKRKQGLFADATTLLGLFGDKDVGAGLLAGCLLAAAMLFAVEMAPLLALGFLPTTPVDVERIAQDRADAARIIAGLEIELMQSASRRAVRVRPLHAGAEAPPHSNPQTHESEV